MIDIRVNSENNPLFTFEVGFSSHFVFSFRDRYVSSQTPSWSCHPWWAWWCWRPHWPPKTKRRSRRRNEGTLYLHANLRLSSKMPKVECQVETSKTIQRRSLPKPKQRRTKKLSAQNQLSSPPWREAPHLHSVQIFLFCIKKEETILNSHCTIDIQTLYLEHKVNGSNH